MDDLEKCLKRDAQQIRIEPSPELQLRIDASLRAAREIGPATQRSTPSTTFWLISSLTGLAAAALVLLLIEWNQDDLVPPADAVAGVEEPTSFVNLPEDWMTGEFPLNVKSADLTRSLEQELIDLQADLERARENVEQDVKNSF